MSTGAIFIMWFLCTMIWHGTYSNIRANFEPQIRAKGPMFMTFIDIFKHAIPTVVFVYLDLGTYIFNLLKGL